MSKTSIETKLLMNIAANLAMSNLISISDKNAELYSEVMEMAQETTKLIKEIKAKEKQV